MDLTSDTPFWSVKNGLITTYPPLRADTSCDVVVIGAGITGSMLAHRLTADGHKVIVIDRRDICTGSTSASTALLQYEIDITLVEMGGNHWPQKRGACLPNFPSVDRRLDGIGRIRKCRLWLSA